MKNKLVILTIVIFLFSLMNFTIGAEENKVVIYFFWGEGCPHCAAEKIFLDGLKVKYPQIEIKSFETWHNQENAALFVKIAEAYGTKASGVPTTFIGDNYIVGYRGDETTGREIENLIKECIDKGGCINPEEKLFPKENICIHIFIKSTCPQCQELMPYLNYVKDKYGVIIKIHDILNESNRELYEKFKEIYNLEGVGYPTAFIGEKYFIGNNLIKTYLENEIENCLKDGCECPIEKIDGKTPHLPGYNETTPEEGNIIDLPFFGKINTSEISLPVFTIIIASLDSFNPCAFFVLFFLLSMLIHARSRARMLLIGGVFVFFSGFMYFLFMAAWLNLFLFIGELPIITKIAGIIALIIALINIKDFFFFEKGISLVIPESAKPKLFKKMRNLLGVTSLPSIVLSTIILAIAANTYELLCTAGFPMVFTRVLTLHEIPTMQYYIYLAFYNLVYVIPLILIVLAFTLTLGARKLTEWQGQVLKLISGMMMLCLGLVLLTNPALLNNIFASFGILAIALLMAMIIIFVTKKIKK
ncbi:MAG: glutaredoxin domain-containing protein [Candidatus Altiarchaeota archaeon]